ncbi:MAG: cysteine synthase A [Symbiobacteriia bacterium]
MAKIANSIIDLIGNTPLLRLNKLTQGLQAEVLVKIEIFNPGLSIKDRGALGMIEGAERRGLLKPGSVVVSQTSGNLGTGLAIVCAAKGYHMVAVMSETMSEERRQMLRALGAEVVLIPAGSPIRGVVTTEDYTRAKAKADEIARERNGFWVDQFENEDNLLTHRRTTGPEIIEQTDGQLDAFVAAVGSAGTAMGVAYALKKFNPKIKVVVVEPATSAPISGGPVIGHHIQGIATGTVPKFYDPSLTDEVITVTDEEAAETARRMAAEEGLFAGYSSGANVAAALKVAKNMPAGQRVVTVVNDTGLKYLSTDLYRWD